MIVLEGGRRQWNNAVHVRDVMLWMHILKNIPSVMSFEGGGGSMLYLNSYKYYIDSMIVTFQNSKLNLNAAKAREKKVAKGAHEATSHGGRTITSPSPLQARLTAAIRKPAQVGYYIPVNECAVRCTVFRDASC
jgi:hypothetical protein